MSQMRSEGRESRPSPLPDAFPSFRGRYTAGQGHCLRHIGPSPAVMRRRHQHTLAIGARASGSPGWLQAVTATSVSSRRDEHCRSAVPGASRAARCLLAVVECAAARHDVRLARGGVRWNRDGRLERPVACHGDVCQRLALTTDSSEPELVALTGRVPTGAIVESLASKTDRRPGLNRDPIDGESLGKTHGSMSRRTAARPDARGNQ